MTQRKFDKSDSSPVLSWPSHLWAHTIQCVSSNFEYNFLAQCTDVILTRWAFTYCYFVPAALDIKSKVYDLLGKPGLKYKV